MRYSPDHKDKTHHHILQAAGRLFRRHGYDGVGIDRIMEEAGLTRGGFYSHFRSKEALLGEIMRHDHDFISKMKARKGAQHGELAEEGLEIIRGYLAPENREQVGQGCTLAACCLDSIRSKLPIRTAYGDAMQTLANEFARGLDGAQPNDPRALAAISLCIGGLLVSRAVAQEELADQISTACKNMVEEIFQPSNHSEDAKALNS